MSNNLKNKLDLFLYTTLVFILCSDLNNFFSNIIGIKEILSLPILFITIILFSRLLFIKKISPNLPVTLYYSIFILLFVYGALLNIISSFPNQDTFYRFRYYTPAILIFTISIFFINNFTKNIKLNFILNVFSFSFIFNSLLIAVTAASGQSLANPIGQYGEIERAGGLISNVNQAGAIAVLGQIFSLYLVLNRGSKINTLLGYSFYILCVTAAISTFSKAAMLNSTVIFLFFCFNLFIKFREKKSSHFKNTKLTIFNIILILTLIISFGIYKFDEFYTSLSLGQKNRIDQFHALLNGQINEETTTMRSKIAEVAMIYISEKPITGHGLGTFHRLPVIRYGTHNEFLLLWGEVGILGPILYLMLFITIFFKINKLHDNNLKFLFTSLVIFLFFVSFVTHNILNAKFFSLVMGLLIGCTLNVRYINYFYRNLK